MFLWLPWLMHLVRLIRLIGLVVVIRLALRLSLVLGLHLGVLVHRRRLRLCASIRIVIVIRLMRYEIICIFVVVCGAVLNHWRLHFIQRLLVCIHIHARIVEILSGICVVGIVTGGHGLHIFIHHCIWMSGRYNWNFLLRWICRSFRHHFAALYFHRLAIVQFFLHFSFVFVALVFDCLRYITAVAGIDTFE